MTKLATSMYKSIAVAPRTISGKDICSAGQDQDVGKMPSNRFSTLSKDFQLFCKSKETKTFVTWYGDIIADKLFQVHLERGQSSACLLRPPPSASRRSQPGQNLAGSLMTLNRVTTVGNRPRFPPRERSSWTSHPGSPEHLPDHDHEEGDGQDHEEDDNWETRTSFTSRNWAGPFHLSVLWSPTKLYSPGKYQLWSPVWNELSK